MVDPDLTLPNIFYTLLDQREKAQAITPEVFETYCSLIQDAPNFLLELMEVIGPDKLLELIKLYGGVSLEIPSPSDILSVVRKSNES